jgi:predicted nucleic acid-binding protein
MRLGKIWCTVFHNYRLYRKDSEAVCIFSLEEEEYELTLEFIRKYSIKPSDSLHLGAMRKNNINIIISEDKELDKVDWIKRMWALAPI